MKRIALFFMVFTANVAVAQQVYVDLQLDSLIMRMQDAIAVQKNIEISEIIGNAYVTSIGGWASWSYISDGRAKKNIRADVPGLAFINLLQPVTYNLNLDAADEIMKSDDPKVNHFFDSLRLSRSPEENEILAKARANKEKQVYSGFIAQDVEKAAQSLGYDFSGVEIPENDKSVYALRYSDFVVPLQSDVGV